MGHSLLRSNPSTGLSVDVKTIVPANHPNWIIRVCQRMINRLKSVTETPTVLTYECKEGLKPCAQKCPCRQ